MQHFRSEPTLRCYYDVSYEFRVEEAESDTADEKNSAIMEGEDKLMSAYRVQDNGTVDWSPNRTRFRGQRRKKVEPEKKIEVPSVWRLPPAS
jgi:hypothetical protein